MSGKPMTTVTTGVTREGVHVEIRARGDIRIDGEQVKLLRHEKFRDGGTTVYVTDCGTLTLPRSLRDPDRIPRWEPSS